MAELTMCRRASIGRTAPRRGLTMTVLTMAVLTITTMAVLRVLCCTQYGSTHYGYTDCRALAAVHLCLLWLYSQRLQFAATKAVLQQRPRAYYERLLLWLITPHDSMHTKGTLPSYHPARLITPHDSMHTKGALPSYHPARLITPHDSMHTKGTLPSYHPARLITPHDSMHTK
eukprot:scaffold36758_cov54-Phaeocystis_antarctica.AAC.1